MEIINLFLIIWFAPLPISIYLTAKFFDELTVGICLVCIIAPLLTAFVSFLCLADQKGPGLEKFFNYKLWYKK